jgi:hypothetical protein
MQGMINNRKRVKACKQHYLPQSPGRSTARLWLEALALGSFVPLAKMKDEKGTNMDTGLRRSGIGVDWNDNWIKKYQYSRSATA